jgi:hypothetical protein
MSHISGNAAEHYNILHSRVKERCRHEKETTKERHRRKFQSCSGTSQHESVKKKWGINASTRNLSRDEIDLLQKGLNFAITPRVVPTKEILAAVEQGVRNFTEEEQNEVRQKVTSALKQAKAQKKQNLSSSQTKALKGLRTAITS